MSVAPARVETTSEENASLVVDRLLVAVEKLSRRPLRLEDLVDAWNGLELSRRTVERLVGELQRAREAAAGRPELVPPPSSPSSTSTPAAARSSGAEPGRSVDQDVAATSGANEG